jgi:hypothetical protein
MHNEEKFFLKLGMKKYSKYISIQNSKEKSAYEVI